ncbi:MAG: heme-degrading domain-containing protein [Salinibacterium sp.]|nr:heme-degrading domain-containing protein [Salinibacterium sp.]
MTSIAEVIAQVEADEKRLVFATFTSDDAFRLGTLIRELAVTRGHAITIDIAQGDQRLFHTALPGTSAHNAKWIERKKRTVREWAASSYAVGLRFPILDAPYTLEDAPWMDPMQYSGSGGGFPIVVTGAGLIGTIAVSGLRHDLDHALIVEALTEFLEADPGA